MLAPGKDNEGTTEYSSSTWNKMCTGWSHSNTHKMLEASKNSRSRRKRYIRGSSHTLEPSHYPHERFLYLQMDYHNLLQNQRFEQAKLRLECLRSSDWGRQGILPPSSGIDCQPHLQSTLDTRGRLQHDNWIGGKKGGHSQIGQW